MEIQGSGGKVRMFIRHGSLQKLSFTHMISSSVSISLLWITPIAHAWGSGSDEGRDVRNASDSHCEHVVC